MFTHIAIHTPKPEHRDAVLASMNRARAAAAGAPGLIQMGPWSEDATGRLVGLAVWESQEAWAAAAPAIFAVVRDDPFDLWEAAPIDSLRLTDASDASDAIGS